jgi:hypothetical protein
VAYRESAHLGLELSLAAVLEATDARTNALRSSQIIG